MIQSFLFSHYSVTIKTKCIIIQTLIYFSIISIDIHENCLHFLPFQPYISSITICLTIYYPILLAIPTGRRFPQTFPFVNKNLLKLFNPLNKLLFPINRSGRSNKSLKNRRKKSQNEVIEKLQEL